MIETEKIIAGIIEDLLAVNPYEITNIALLQFYVINLQNSIHYLQRRRIEMTAKAIKKMVKRKNAK